MKKLQKLILLGGLICCCTIFAPVTTIHVKSLMYAHNQSRFSNVKFLYTTVTDSSGSCAQAVEGLMFKSLLPESCDVEVVHDNMKKGYKLVCSRDSVDDDKFTSLKAVKIDEK